MRDFLIYNEADFKKGKMIGSEIVDENLQNKFKVLNSSNFNDPVFTNWQDEILNEKFVEDITYSNEDDYVNLAISNDNITDKIGTEKFCSVETNFFDENNVPIEVDNLSLNISWNSAEIQHEEKAIIKITGHTEETVEDPYQEIHISNKAKMMIRSYHPDEGESIEYITDTAAGSIRPITNYISNYIDEGYLDFRVFNDTLHTRFRSKGSYSEWYEFHFDQDISKLEIIQPTNELNLNRVYKKLAINSILIEGYNSGVIYESDVIDAGEKNSYFNTLEVAGIPNIDELHSTSTTANVLEVHFHYGNNIEDMNEQHVTIPHELEGNTFSLQKSLEEIKEDRLKGRYAKIKIVNVSRYFQNLIDHIILSYTPQSLLDKIDKQVDEYVIEDVDMSKSNIVEAETENFPFRIVIPEGANGPESVDIIRHEEGELFAEGMFGFEFNPIPELDRYILIEVDYSGYNFNPYMSEEGLLIGYLDVNEEPRQLESITFGTRNKVLAYYL